MNESKTACHLLFEVRSLLLAQGERNWLGGINAALNELSNPDNSINEAGYEKARSIYLGMTMGGRGFSDYWVPAKNEQSDETNRKLDDLRTQLWRLFY